MANQNLKNVYVLRVPKSPHNLLAIIQQTTRTPIGMIMSMSATTSPHDHGHGHADAAASQPELGDAMLMYVSMGMDKRATYSQHAREDGHLRDPEHLKL